MVINNTNKTKDKNFLLKYLLNTWLLELIIGQKENLKKGELIPDIRAFIRNQKHGDDYVNKILLYFILRIHGRFEEYIELTTIRQDFNEAIISLINYKNMKESLDFIKMNVSFGVEDVKNIFKKLFFKYATLFMKQNPVETIELLEQ